MQFRQIKRRDFITLLGGAAAWPLAARAQQPQGMRRIGVLEGLSAEDQEAQARLSMFAQGLKELGWVEGRNIEFVVRLGPTIRKHAEELAVLAPDVILAAGSSQQPAMLRG